MRLSPQGLLGAILLLKIIAQCVHNGLVFHNAAGFLLHSPLFRQLLPLVIAGRWGECLETIQAEDPEPRVQTIAAHLIQRKQYLELLGLWRHRLAASRIHCIRIHPRDVSTELMRQFRREMLSLDRAIMLHSRVQQRIGLFLLLVQLLPPRMGERTRRLGRCWY